MKKNGKEFYRSEKIFKQYPEMSWDQAIADIANNWAFNGSESENSRQGDTW